MSLAPILRCPPVVSLVPDSGIQIVDLGFTADRSTGIQTHWVFHEVEGQSPIQVDAADDVAGATYSVDLKKLVETYGGVWMPIPMFRGEGGDDYARGPTNWARVHLTRLGAADETGFDHRVLVAFDTALLSQHKDEAYLAPSTEDAQRGAVFSICRSQVVLDWFVQEQWVTDWCWEAVRDMVTREERRRRRSAGPVDDAQIAERLEGPKEAVARYKALVYLLAELDLVPGVRMIDCLTEPRSAPIDVDCVLDVGNSRTCGMLIETHPDQIGADITQAVKVKLRDLSDPTQIYTDPFESRIEFNRACFGKDDISLTSGRSTSFAWPTVARIGPEAQRLAGLKRGNEGATGMSSPKRYLWDEDPRRDGWRFNEPAGHGEHASMATGVVFTTLVNDSGEPLHRIPGSVSEHDERRFPSFRALYARSNLMAFALTEVFLQTLVMMNSVAHRLRRRNADLPRRLRRIIMTMPTALPLAERQILRRQAENARDLVYLCLGLAEPADGHRIRMKGAPGEEEWLPEIKIDWDEASATQAVYLYSRIAMSYSGDARAFFRRSRLPINRTDPELTDHFRLGTLDIGGGTTDLVVTAYRVEGQGANVTLVPEQRFREGMSVAGDDIAFQLIREHVVAPITQALEDGGLSGDRAQALVDRLFGGDRGEMHIEEQFYRQQFAVHLAMPAALSLIGRYEEWDALSGVTESAAIGFEDLFTESGVMSSPVEAIIAYVNGEAQREGAIGFDLAQVRLPVHYQRIDRTVRSIVLEMLQALAEIVYRARADLLILSGRPSRMPAVNAILTESMALPPHRVIPLHSFQVGAWYPFRDYASTISDPKTTATVGAMICLLGEGRLKNFHCRSHCLTTRSTARFFGKLDRDNRLREDNVYYRDLDLENEDYELSDEPFEFRGPMTLGFRQFSADWWPGTRLYNLDYANPEAAARLNARTPLAVTLRRHARSENTAIADAFTIDQIEDAEGRTVPARELRLRLQTIDNQDGYWLDTGILLDR